MIPKRAKKKNTPIQSNESQVMLGNDVEDVDVLVNRMLTMEDINADPNGDSSKSQDRSAKEKFVAFLGGIVSFENIPIAIDKHLEFLGSGLRLPSVAKTDLPKAY